MTGTFPLLRPPCEYQLLQSFETFQESFIFFFTEIPGTFKDLQYKHKNQGFHVCGNPATIIRAFSYLAWAWWSGVLFS